MRPTQLIAMILSVPIAVVCTEKLLSNTFKFITGGVDEWMLWIFGGMCTFVIAYAVAYLFIAYPIIWILNKILTSTETFKDL